MTVEAELQALAERWADADAGEHANFQLYLTELCDALNVTHPQPRGTGYEFEFPVKVVEADGTETTKSADLFRQGHFLLEAKDILAGKSDESLLRKAYGQARGYVTHLPGDPPPYLLVLDVAQELLVWDRWNGTYGGFAAAERVDLRRLHERPDDIEFVRTLWEEPERLDPRAKASAVTKEIAEHLAELAAALEERGHDHEQVARFLIRCVFTMFAEDVGLLEGDPFLEAVRDIGLEDPGAFTGAVERLWEAMDEGKEFGLRTLLRFNGHFFEDRSALPLEADDLAVLLEAARADWQYVEPSIFGTLFTRALDPEERHRLGAEFTPRSFVERLVRPTIEEPVRERWRAVEASVFQLRETGKKTDRKKAEKQLREFHRWLRSLKVLDPACGSGNFLYVSLAALKRIEGEVLRTLEDLTGEPDILLEEVNPAQFHGLEIEPWAREIAELTLWIGFHQYWQEHHGHTRPPEPVLKDTGTLECRDAVLAWDERVERPEKARPDSTPRVKHPVTGKLVPDPDATVAYWEHTHPRPAEWPEADFIIGNPPYMGRARQREEFGDGYVEALRETYEEIPETADYVMYWWYRAARAVLEGDTIRAGLITTNSITQAQQRSIIEDAAKEGVRVVWAVPDHPWVDETGSAQVRVAMTVLEREPRQATVVEVDDAGEIVQEFRTARLNSDLSAYANVTRAADEELLANEGLSSNGFNVVGRGFVLEPGEAEELLEEKPERSDIIRPYRNGRDLTQTPRGVYIIDFGTRDESEAREWPTLFDIVRDRVKPERDSNNRKRYREYWWQFGETRPGLRAAVADLDRYIATPYVSKHRFFTFLDAAIAPDDALRVVASDDPFHLGVLSSRIHVAWALASGGRLGIGNDPRYNHTLCFQPFPFPDPEADLREEIGDVGAKLDEHRTEAAHQEEQVTVTGIYNVITKLRAGEELTDREREIHRQAACGVLRDVHDELDALVADAYGWEWPLTDRETLERLVALHDERRTEEARGEIRWLRPEYQHPKFAPEGAEAPELELVGEEEEAERPEWPEENAVRQIAALQEALEEAPGSAADLSDRFRGARQNLVERHLETLVLLGEARRSKDGRYHPVREPVVA
jgi:hypothetical protein